MREIDRVNMTQSSFFESQLNRNDQVRIYIHIDIPERKGRWERRRREEGRDTQGASHNRSEGVKEGRVWKMDKGEAVEKGVEAYLVPFYIFCLSPGLVCR